MKRLLIIGAMGDVVELSKAAKANGIYEKCQEILLQMEVAGVVDRFSEVFDIERFHRRHDDFLVFYLMYVNHYTATDLGDLKPFLRRRIPLTVYLRWIVARIADRLFHYP